MDEFGGITEKEIDHTLNNFMHDKRPITKKRIKGLVNYLLKRHTGQVVNICLPNQNNQSLIKRFKNRINGIIAGKD